MALLRARLPIACLFVDARRSARMLGVDIQHHIEDFPTPKPDFCEVAAFLDAHAPFLDN
jgi:hypothetical protein